MNKTILISILIALTFSFLIFYTFHEFFPPQKASDIKMIIHSLQKIKTLIQKKFSYWAEAEQFSLIQL